MTTSIANLQPVFRGARHRAARGAAALAALLGCSGAAHACWQEAAERYKINPYLLKAIAQCESSLNPAAVNRSHFDRTGTYDVGLMQINTSNLQALRQHGIGESELYDSCTNINVGAWILAQKIQRYGNTWEAVGAYNAACTQLKGEACNEARDRYARCVYRNLPPELKTATGEPPVSSSSAAAAPDQNAQKPVAAAVQSQRASVRASAKAGANAGTRPVVSPIVSVKVMP